LAVSQKGLGECHQNFEVNMPDTNEQRNEQRRVSGQVRLEDGTPAERVSVRAFNRTLHDEQLLGQSTTDKEGFYEIRYSLRPSKKSEARSIDMNVDLVVKVFADDGSLLAASPTQFNAPAVVELDLTIPAGVLQPPPLFEKIDRALKPLLRRANLLELEQDDEHQDLSFLSGKTGFETQSLARFVVAQRLAEKALAPELWFALLGSSPFQSPTTQTLTEHNLAQFAGTQPVPEQTFPQSGNTQTIAEQTVGVLNRLPSLDALAVRKALGRSINQKEVPPLSPKQIDKAVEDFLDLAAARTLTAETGPTFIKLALVDAQVTDEKKQQKFARLFLEHRALNPRMLEELEKERYFKDKLPDLQTSFQLSDLTEADFSVIKIIKDEFGVRQAGDIRMLAKKSEAEWIKLVKARHRAKQIKLPAVEAGPIPTTKMPPDVEGFAKTLARQFREAFPTTAFAGDLEQAVKKRDLQGLSNGGKLRDFLNRYPNFEFLTTSIDDFLHTEDAGNRSFAEDEAFRTELKAVQRVFKLAPAFNQTNALLADNLHSAEKIYRTGESEFVRRYAEKDGFTTEDARRTWNRAADTHAAVMTIVGDLKSLQTEGLPAVLQNNGQALESFPNWHSLFAAGDLCECDHCGSVLGPAAYFTDLLMFLKDRRSKVSRTVKEILFIRRSDLGEIELSCENATTPIPYIDLVNEVLEDRLAPPQPIALNGAIEADLTAGLIKPAVLKEFKEKHIAISPEAQVFPGDGEHWTVRDGEHTYRILKFQSALGLLVSRQTLFSAAEVRANPQYTNQDAYKKLKAEVFPFSLPFDLWQIQVRAYLEHLGVPQPRLQTLFQRIVKEQGLTKEDPTGLQIDCAWLDITETERQILTWNNVAEPISNIAPWGFWGLQETDNDIPSPESPSVPEKNIKGTWIEVLSHVNVMLNRTRLTYQELLQLLDLDYVNPMGGMVIGNADPNGSNCDTANLRIENLPGDKSTRMHRFIRLWRKLGCAMWELDLLLPNLADEEDEEIAKRITDEALQDISRMLRLNEKTGLDWRTLLSFYRDIDHRVYFDRNQSGTPAVATLYQRLFRNPLLVDADGVASFPATPGELDGPDGGYLFKIADKLPGILMAFRIKEIDLDLILADLKWSIEAQVDIKTLSTIHRITVLARSLGLTIDEFLRLKRLWGRDPFETAEGLKKKPSPLATLQFVHFADQIAAQQFSVLELEYLLQHQFTPGSGVALETAKIVAVVTSIRDGLQRISDEMSLKSEETAEAYVRTNLGLLPALAEDTDEDIALRVIDDTWEGTVAARNDLIDRFFKVLNLTDPNSKLAKIERGLSSEEYKAAIRDRFKYVQKALEPFLLKTSSEDLIQQIVSETLSFDAMFAGFLLNDLQIIEGTVLMQSINDPRLLAKNPDGTYANVPIDMTTFPDIFKSLIRLHKVAMVIVKLDMKADDLVWWMNNVHPDRMGWMRANNFPVDETSSKVDIQQWLAMQQFYAWKKDLPKSETALEFAHSLVYPLDPESPEEPLQRTRQRRRHPRENTEELVEKSPDQIISELAKLTGWSETDLKTLRAAFNWEDQPGHSRNLRTELRKTSNLRRLTECMSALQRLGVSAERALTWAKAEPGSDEAESLKHTLKTKYDLKEWQQIIQPMEDEFREQKRQALVVWLVTHPNQALGQNWSDTNGLYGYFLLDVEMSACQLTSRLVQATGSVQLFVQRCFMGLEPEVTVKADGLDGDTAWRWWKWMRKYRVWEANRKVFLWPENWIEPELKRDRSPFFKDMENHLLQNEINQYTVEDAFRSYLEKLDGVAQLEIAGFYHEDDGDETIVHVFGRTRGAEPHTYYYRRYDYRQWTPWEKVDLDIQGEYLIPAVVNKRLFLYWPVFTEVADAVGNDRVPIPRDREPFDIQRTRKRLRLQLAVSEYRQGKWTPKRLSKDFGQNQRWHKKQLGDPEPDPNNPEWYDATDLVHNYTFLLVDRTDWHDRAYIAYWGVSLSSSIHQPKTLAEMLAYFLRHPLSYGAFDLAGCEGVPKTADPPIELTEWEELVPGFTMPFPSFKPVIQPQMGTANKTFQKWVERELDKRTDAAPKTDFSLDIVIPQTNSGPRLIPLLQQTPEIFEVSSAWCLSYIDKLRISGTHWKRLDQFKFGSYLPFFYNENKRTFLVLPVYRFKHTDGKIYRQQYPVTKGYWLSQEPVFRERAKKWVEDAKIESWDEETRWVWESFLYDWWHPHEPPPPYNDNNYFKSLLERYRAEVERTIGTMGTLDFSNLRFHFKNFYHPFVCDFGELVNNPVKGIPALLSRETQNLDGQLRFPQRFQPTRWLLDPPEDFEPREVVDFTPDGAYSPYNWELFFHAPLLIANALSKNQRFEEAREWYHFIFNPLGVEGGMPNASPISKYWITKPFFETTDAQYLQQRIEHLLELLSDPNAPGRAEIEAQVRDWRTNPFEPHRIANYRTVAYQKTVVMKYLDNLIEWGDYLFRQDSMESINEATQIYILAAELLGPRPKKVPTRVKPSEQTFNELENELDKFSNATAELENLVPALAGSETSGGEVAPLPTLYFCIPHNEKLLGYWDTVGDRLFKIRHCMNIEGVTRQLALFEPPIDPAVLVKAVAAGVDIGSAMADLNAPLPLYRFNVLLQKANEVCNDVKSLGSSLLAALEKKDAEQLSLLRQGQEISMLEVVKTVREQQIDEARENLEGIKKSKKVVEERRNYYRDIVKITPREQQSLDRQGMALDHQNQAYEYSFYASLLGYLPNITLGGSGFGGSPVATTGWGSSNIMSALQALSTSETQLSNSASHAANMHSTLAGYDRRFDEFKLQERLANKELDQIDKSIAAAELRVALAEKELENHLRQIENAKAMDEFMRSKYTNGELYQWQVGQISGVYFQSYRLAYDLAKRAERCFQFELGLASKSYISPGSWDSLNKGLLSGEKLQYDLRRLETAYFEQNRREFELTKSISLLMLQPLELVRLRETGKCDINLPEEIFDLDYPGHYFRRIKSVSISVPCVVGPYTTLSCTLRLKKNSVRFNTQLGKNSDDKYGHNRGENGEPLEDDRFIENRIPVNAIAASHGQNDSGVFELSFRDERYLPFEGAGVISEWSLELFNDEDSQDFGKALRQFDYSTISDAILHVKYTAKEDAGAFKKLAIAHLHTYFTPSHAAAAPSVRMLNLRQEFPTQWHHFRNPATPNDTTIFELEMARNLFPVRDTEKILKVTKIWLLARSSALEKIKFDLIVPGQTRAIPIELTQETDQFGNLHFGEAPLEVEILPAAPPVKWKLAPPAGESLPMAQLEDLFLVIGYEWKATASNESAFKECRI
jgi:hypothetical protein